MSKSATASAQDHNIDDIETLQEHIDALRQESGDPEYVDMTPVLSRTEVKDGLGPEVEANEEPLEEEPADEVSAEEPDTSVEEKISPTEVRLTSKSEQFINSMKMEQDRIDAVLRGVEAEMISLQETTVSAENQAIAEYEAAIAQAKRTLERTLARLEGDKNQMMEELEASKRDFMIVLNGLSAAIEAAVAKRSELDQQVQS